MYLYFLNYPWQNSSVISAHWLQLPNGEDNLGAWETNKGSSSTVTCSTKGWKTIWVSFKLKLKAADPNFSNPLILKAETTQWRHWGDLNSSQSSWEVEELWSWWAGALQQAEILECPAGKHNASTAQAFGGAQDDTSTGLQWMSIRIYSAIFRIKFSEQEITVYLSQQRWRGASATDTHTEDRRIPTSFCYKLLPLWQLTDF